MRLFCIVLLAACLCVLSVMLDGARLAALAQVILPSSLSGSQLVLDAKIVCGTFDGKFGCRNIPGTIERGKNAIPGARINTPDEGVDNAPPAQGESGWTQPAPGETPATTETGCQKGMVGTPPDCRCPQGSELLGGNCVHYTASACSSGLAPDALPQACRGVEEKLSCTMRQDGLKDCCCVTYDKF
jgi:hypothetical protein